MQPVERSLGESGVQPNPLSIRDLLLSALLVSLGAAVGQGFARFGYALLLTSMQRDLGWSYAQAGLLNSANALGYLVGSLAVGPVVARWQAPRVVRLSLLTVIISLITTGLFDNAAMLFLSRIVSGVGTGLLYIAGAAVVLGLDSSHRSDLPVAVYYTGPGIGITLSGLLIPFILGPLGWDWHAAWITLGVLSIFALIAVEIPLRATRRVTTVTAQNERLFVLGDYWRLWPALVTYTLYGVGYIGYMTFVVAFLRSIDVAPGLVQGFWVLLGVCTVFSGFTWRPLIRRLRPHHILSLVMAILAVATLLPALVPQTWSFVVSAVFFGSTFLSVIAIVTLQTRMLLPQTRWTTLLGNATALFALGQLVGPTLTGIVADLRGGLALGLIGSAATLGLGSLIALCGSRSFQHKI